MKTAMPLRSSHLMNSLNNCSISIISIIIIIMISLWLRVYSASRMQLADSPIHHLHLLHLFPLLLLFVLRRWFCQRNLHIRISKRLIGSTHTHTMHMFIKNWMIASKQCHHSVAYCPHSHSTDSSQPHYCHAAAATHCRQQQFSSTRQATEITNLWQRTFLPINAT